MFTRQLVKTDRIEIDGRAYPVDYFEATTDAGHAALQRRDAARPGRSHHCRWHSLSDLDGAWRGWCRRRSTAGCCAATQPTAA